MRFYADIHIHSYYSRATSKNCNLEHLHKWAQLKGITVVGTGDFVHPGWMQELQEKLEPAEDGLFRLKPEFAASTQAEVPASCAAPVRFMLTCEISNIYKRLDKVRKIHNLIYAPDFESALRIQAKLDQIGNIRSDGRPILGLDSRDLLEITLEAGERTFLVPAHIWTPWFAALGSKGGFDRIEDCFADLTSEIFAVETGLSSDPIMNWRLEQLDPYILISNSDAHSPPKLGRESNLFDTELSYQGMYEALKLPENKGLLETIEFFPEEGKYHYDGHRKCNARLHPQESAKYDGLCPVCKKPVVVGVMARVEALADHPEGRKPPRWRPYTSLIPLPEIIAEAKGVGANSKTVQQAFQQLLAKLGNELYILRDAPIESVQTAGGTLIAEGIRRVREGAVHIAAGYDGEFGTIRIFEPEERQKLSRQASFLPAEKTANPSSKLSKNIRHNADSAAADADESGERAPDSPAQQGSDEEDKVRNFLYQMPVHEQDSTKPVLNHRRNIPELPEPQRAPFVSDLHLGTQLPEDVNSAQWLAVTHWGSHLMIIAGPGTGKTHTLTYRIAHVAQCFAAEQDMLAITFTNRAAEEMQSRLRERLQDQADAITVGTFHSFALQVLRQYGHESGLPEKFAVATPEQVQSLMQAHWTNKSAKAVREGLEQVSQWKSSGKTSRQPEIVKQQIEALRAAGMLDFDDLIFELLRLLREQDHVKELVQGAYRYIFVDEYQDINGAQHALLKELVQNGVHLTAIGDPNQSIYSFRGANPKYFHQFSKDYKGARTLHLADNYRSAANLLTASGQVIARNPRVKMPALTAKIMAKGQLLLHAAQTDKAEAEYIVHQIEKLVGGTSMFSQDSGRVASERDADRSFGDIAVLYRVGAQRAALEEAFQRSGIPYQMSGETPLASRKNVPEMLTALRLANTQKVNLQDAGALLQFLIKGFGKSHQKKIQDVLNADALDLQMLQQLPARKSLFSPEIRRQLAERGNELQELADKLQGDGLIAAMQHLIVLPGWQPKFSGDAEMTANWERLLYVARVRRKFGDFMDYLLLQRPEDGFEHHAERVSLFTLHTSKGLEFPVVFVAGCEDGLLPLEIAGMESDPEEERRLFYVGMTRAKEQLVLTRAKQRTLFGKTQQTRPSPYLSDIEEQLKAYEKAARGPRRRSRKKVDTRQLTLFG